MLRVLFIGNSYTFFHDLPGLVAALARSRDQRIDVAASVIPGATLETQWDQGTALAALRGSRWDVVVLQERSRQLLEDPDAMMRFAGKFADAIGRRGARTVLFLPWAKRDAPATQADLTRVTYAVARAIGADVAPVGVAWERAVERGLDPFGDDGNHPDPRGTYLAACVFYATLFDASPVGIGHRLVRQTLDGKSHRPEELAPDLAARLQEAAWEGVTAARSAR
jgi:hypothetical protein